MGREGGSVIRFVVKIGPKWRYRVIGWRGSGVFFFLLASFSSLFFPIVVGERKLFRLEAEREKLGVDFFLSFFFLTSTLLAACVDRPRAPWVF